MAAEKGLGVQRDLDVGGVLDGVTDQNQVGDGRLLVPVWSLLTVAFKYTDMTRAVEHLERRQDGNNTFTLIFRPHGE